MFALRRVASASGRATLTAYHYNAGRLELLDSDYAALVLPTSAQIAAVAGDWETALALAGMEKPSVDFRATPVVRLIWHFYEVKGKLPTDPALREYCNRELCIGMPRAREKTWAEYLDDLRAARAERGWATPDDGPLEDERLSEVELAALLDGARPTVRRGGWTEEAVVAAFVEFAELFHGRRELTLRLYKAHAPEHGWPGSSTFERHGGFTALKERAVTTLACRATRAA